MESQKPNVYKNRDIGDLERQHARFFAFCHSYAGCGGCPVRANRKSGDDCFTKWLDLDYADTVKAATSATSATEEKDVPHVEATPKSEEKHDAVNHPKHYTSDPSGVECIDVVQHRDFCVGNAIKYLWRAGLKTSANKTAIEKEIEDLEKAIWYIGRKIELLKKCHELETGDT